VRAIFSPPIGALGLVGLDADNQAAIGTNRHEVHAEVEALLVVVEPGCADLSPVGGLAFAAHVIDGVCGLAAALILVCHVGDLLWFSEPPCAAPSPKEGRGGLSARARLPTGMLASKMGQGPRLQTALRSAVTNLTLADELKPSRLF